MEKKFYLLWLFALVLGVCLCINPVKAEVVTYPQYPFHQASPSFSYSPSPSLSPSPSPSSSLSPYSHKNTDSGFKNRNSTQTISNNQDISCSQPYSEYSESTPTSPSSASSVVRVNDTLNNINNAVNLFQTLRLGW